MKKFMSMMEKYFVPVAGKIGSQRHLVAIRDGFIFIMPLIMAGSFAVLLNVFLRDIPTTQGWDNMVELFAPIVTINGAVWWGTLAIMSLALVFTLGYNLAVSYGEDGLSAGVISFSAFIVTIPQTKFLESGDAVWGVLDSFYIGATGLFTAIIVAIIATEIYVRLVKRNIVIKMPDTVPPSVSKAFVAIIPGIIAIYTVAVMAYLVFAITGYAINELIYVAIQQPLLNLSQGLGAVIVIVLLIQLFWFFGLHGANMLAPVINAIYLPALTENSAALLAGEELPYIWTSASFDVFVHLGGAGVTLGFVIAIFIFSKRKDTRAVAKLGAPGTLFNINEPILFGTPIVLNPIYIIPFILGPVIAVTIAYTATVVGIIPPTSVLVPWTTPPILGAFLATGGSVMAALIAALNLAIVTLIYAPFVYVANKITI